MGLSPYMQLREVDVTALALAAMGTAVAPAHTSQAAKGCRRLSALPPLVCRLSMGSCVCGSRIAVRAPGRGSHTLQAGLHAWASCGVLMLDRQRAFFVP